MSAWLEQAWLARYLDRQLSDDEVAEFEAYLLDKPHLIEQVEADNLLRQTLHAAEQMEISDEVDSAEPPAAIKPDRMRSWLPIAASFLAALAIGWMLPRQGAVENAYFVAPERVVYDTFRGPDKKPMVYPGSGQSAVFIVEIAVPPGARVVTLQAQVDGEIIPLPVAQASSEGFVTLVLPQDWRGRSALEVRVEEIAGDGADRLAFPL